MSPDKPRPRTKRCGIEFEEERAWAGFYKRVHRDPAIAAEVMSQLDSEPEMKRRHLALYLGCKESLRLHKSRQAQHKRIGQFVRRLSHVLLGLLGRLLFGLRALLHRAGQIALECLPETRKEPAIQQARRLGRDAEFAGEMATFEQLPAASAARAATGKAPEAKPVSQPTPRAA